MNSEIYRLCKTHLCRIVICITLGISSLAFAQSPYVYPNPILAEDFPTLIQSIATAVIQIGAPLAVLALIFAGFKFITGSLGGDQKAISEAKKIFWWTLIGTAILVGAWAIATAVVNFAKTL